MKKGTKLTLLFLTIALVLCSVIGGTVAWLIAEAKPVVNTFTYGDINITLEETDTGLDGDEDPNTNDYIMIPGKTFVKDPVVTFEANSEDAWLFVKLEKSENFDRFMTYEMAEGWIPLEGVEGVYYREMRKQDTDVVYHVIKDDTVSVKGDVTKQMLNELDANGARNYPTLTVAAYAVQRDAQIQDLDTPAEAWALAVASSENP